VADWPTIVTATAAAVSAAATVIYTVGTFLLWKVTSSSVNLIERQLDQTTRTAEGAVLAEIFRSHREIFLRMIPPDAPLGALWTAGATLSTTDSPDVTNLRTAEEIFGSILINHAAHLFHYYNAGLLHEEMWIHTQDDMKDLFQNPIVQRRWAAVKSFHPKEFQRLVERLLQAN
jgi:hypothetical protein